MTNLRSTIDVLVKNLNANKKEGQSFVFGDYTWKTLMIKKFIQSFKTDEEVMVTIEKQNGYDAMNFKWRNGHAFIYPIEVANALIEKNRKAEAARLR